MNKLNKLNKLNELAARAMGWLKTDDGWENPDPMTDDDKYKSLMVWRPSIDLNDAAELLEKCSRNGAWTCNRNMSEEPAARYWVADNGGYQAWAATMPLAMTICALRASGVSETEISDALK
jgi:hypothetical protein